MNERTQQCGLAAPHRRRRCATTAVALVAVVAIGAACGPPPPEPTYRPGALSPGNRIYLDVGGPGSAANLTIANPGGASPWPADPAHAEDLRLDTLGLGDPTSDLRFGPVAEPSFHFGIFDGDGTLLLDLGPDFGSTLFSADGSTFAVSNMFGDDPSVVVYDTASLSVRRTFAWDRETLGRPTVVDLSRDGSTILLRGAHEVSAPWSPVPDSPVMVATTSGDDPPSIAVPSTGESKFDIRLTSTGRIAYVAEVIGAKTTWQLRTVAPDGTDQRTLLEVPAEGPAVNVAAEIGTGGLVVEAPSAGSTVLSDLFTVDDTPTATRRTIARAVEISSTLGGLTRLVTPA
jgi:hypothetical protein